MRVNYRKEPEDDETLVSKAGKVIGKAAKLAVTAYVGKKVGKGLSDVGKGLESGHDHPGDE
jgi:hypothetical protein